MLCNISSFPFFHECKKLMVLGDTTRMFFSCYCVFFPVSFKYEYACFNVFNCPLATTNSSSVFWIPDKDNLGLPSYLMRDLVADNLLFSTRLQGQKICLIFTSYWLRQPIKRFWRKSIIYIHKATFNIFCNPFIPIFLMYARGKILNKVFLYTTYHLFKMSWGQWWCMKGERFIIKFW